MARLVLTCRVDVVHRAMDVGGAGTGFFVQGCERLLERLENGALGGYG